MSLMQNLGEARYPKTDLLGKSKDSHGNYVGTLYLQSGGGEGHGPEDSKRFEPHIIQKFRSRSQLSKPSFLQFSRLI